MIDKIFAAVFGFIIGVFFGFFLFALAAVSGMNRDKDE